MKIAIDVKNLALFTGGIAAYIKPLINRFIGSEQQIDFVLVGPKIDVDWLQNLDNFEVMEIAWPRILPRQLRHPFYDTVLFPKAIRKVKPDFIFTPYHDVLLPKGIPSVMMIHDTCIADLTDIYPRSIRLYYETMLSINLKRCKGIFTVSNASREAIVKKYQVKNEIVSVIPNAFEASFTNVDGPERMEESKNIVLFYPGGAEFRKNIKRMVLALKHIEDNGYLVSLRVTGNYDYNWQRQLKGIDESLLNKITFLGYLEPYQLGNEYKRADVVIYPSLCEGFGRVCLEAMAMGAKLACSDIPVLHEVAEDYAIYFNPFNVADIAKKVIFANDGCKKNPLIKEEYQEENVAGLFLETIKKYLAHRK